MSGSPLFTVLMPVHNGLPYLEAAVQSILEQSFEDFEFLILDDGSTDGSGELLDSLARSNERLRVLHGPAQGLIKTLNRGLQLACGRYVARMDADDISHPDRLQRQAQFLSTHPDTALLGSACRYLIDDGPTDIILRFEQSPKRIAARIGRVNQFCHPTVVFRRDAALAIGGYQAAFVHAEDCDLWLRMVERFETANLPDVLLDYRLHRQQTSLRHLRQQSISALASRVAARIRHSGQSDPFVHLPIVTVDDLLAAGITKRRVERNIVDHHIRWLGNLERVGFDDAAAELRSTIESVAGELGLAKYAQARLLLEGGLSQAFQGQALRGLRDTCLACVMEPRFVGFVGDLMLSRIARYGWIAR